jgi:hypothetical protein
MTSSCHMTSEMTGKRPDDIFTGLLYLMQQPHYLPRQQLYGRPRTGRCGSVFLVVTKEAAAFSCGGADSTAFIANRPAVASVITKALITVKGSRVYSTRNLPRKKRLRNNPMSCAARCHLDWGRRLRGSSAAACPSSSARRRIA